MPSADHSPLPSRWSGPALVALALVIGIFAGGRAIEREGSYFQPGDPPRYLMDGVFLYDFLHSGAVWHPAEAMQYAERYFVRYPALAIGHHPPLMSLALVPFFAIFGISAFAARVALLTFFALSTLLLYRLVRRFYGGHVAGWACVLFASSPIIASYLWRPVAEMLTIALTLATLASIVRFRESGRLDDYLLFVACAAATLLCRPTALFMFPAYVVLLLIENGYRRFTQPKIAITTAIAFIGCLAGAVVFLAWSPFNSAVVFDVVRRGIEPAAVHAVARTVYREVPLFVPVVVATIAAIVTRDRRALLLLVWIVSVLVSTTWLTGPIEPYRYALQAFPAYCVLAASLFAWVRSGPIWYACTAAFLVIVALQLHESREQPTWDAPGYEQAAQVVLEESAATAAPTVLYSASVDVGYFVFFVRKHDPAQRLVVLRSDKLLTTSMMSELSVEQRIKEPEDIYPLLQRYGTRFVVIEDRPSGSPALDWLRDAVHSDRFIERGRFEIEDGFDTLRGVPLVVYEYRDATPADPDAELDLNIPLVGRRIQVRLSDLVPALPRP